jgi:hypothetical protein
MILAWVISLILFCSALVAHLERITALSIIELNSMKLAQQQWLAAEQAVLECETNMRQVSMLLTHDCFIQSLGNNLWKISSKQKPGIEVQVFLDEGTEPTRRINWRQTFYETK